MKINMVGNAVPCAVSVGAGIGHGEIFGRSHFYPSKNRFIYK